MSGLLWFGLGAMSAGIVAFGTHLLARRRALAHQEQESARETEISVDRLPEVPTVVLAKLAEQFHVLTVGMYEELCTRRQAEQGTLELEAMLHRHDDDPS